MTSRLATVGLFGTLGLGALGYNELVTRYTIPEEYEIAYIAVLVVGSGLFWKGTDMWRFRRTAESLGFSWEGWETPDEPPQVQLFEAYRDEVNGRTVTVGCKGRGSSTRESTVAITSTGDTPTLRVRRSGLGGVPEDSLPPRVPLSSSTLSEYDVYCSDPEFARAVLTGDVQPDIAGIERLDEIRITEGKAKSVARTRILDAGHLQQHADLVCELAEAADHPRIES